MTDSGIVGIPAGAKLEIVDKTSEGYKVKTSDGVVFDAKATQVTQDPTQAATSKQQAAALEAESKAKREAIIAAQNAKLQAQADRMQSAMDSMPKTVDAPAAPASSGVPITPTLESGPKPTNVSFHPRKTKDTKKGK